MSIMPLRLSLATLLCAALPFGAAAEEVTVFAAASMKTALDQVAEGFTAATGHQVLISYAGSNALAKQIIEGAPADVFVSAAQNWMDEVEKAGLVQPGKRQDLLGNSLVLVAHGKAAPAVEISKDLDLGALLGEGKLSMALVDAVPAGQYGKAALESLGLWQAVEPAVAQSDNVRAALTLVSLGEAPYGVVYATDAVADDNVSVVGTFPADSHKPITYPVALLSGAKDAADAAFYEALSGEAAAAIFAAEGFTLLQ